MGFLKPLGKMNELAKKAGYLKADYPQAWALGESLADEALATRSEALMRMIAERGQKGIDSYAEQVREACVQGVASGEIAYAGPVDKDALVAVGIACGMRLQDKLEAEMRQSR